MRFSQRHGYKPIDSLQLERLERGTRNRIWNCVGEYFASRARYFFEEGFYGSIEDDLRTIIDSYYGRFIKADNVADPRDRSTGYIDVFRDDAAQFIKEAEWYEVYDFVEFVLPLTEKTDELTDKLNSILEEERTAYRIVSDIIVPIYNSTEKESIESSVENSVGLIGVHEHLKQAIAHLSNRKNPDYRNSVKESISALESLCKTIADDRTATLGDALKTIEKNGQVDLHKALKQSFSSLYGYTSDADGIRHAMLEESSLTFTDAKYMLVSCSAFINYLISKASDAGLSLAAPST